VDNLGAEQAIEQRIGRRRRRRRAVYDEHRAHPELRSRRRGRARVVGLHAAGGDQRVGAFGLRPRGDQRELADLVAAKPERDRIVSLDQQSWATVPERAAQSRQRFDRRRRGDERKRGKLRNRVAERGWRHAR
jgi:hypothetical protein